MDTTEEPRDEIDAAIEERLATLEKVERPRAGTKARVLRHFERLQFANQVLGWSYERIATELLQPAGLQIAPRTLREYMRQFGKSSESTTKPPAQTPAPSSKGAVARKKKASAESTEKLPDIDASERAIGAAGGDRGLSQQQEHAGGRRLNARL